MKRLRFFSIASLSVAIVTAGFVLVKQPRGAGATSPVASGLIKSASYAAVYYQATNGKRYVFPTEKTYKSWFPDFSNVTVVSDVSLAMLPIGGNITYRPGTKMIKIVSSPQVYAVAKGGVLRWVTQESIAAAYYGPQWNTMVEDVPDAFFTNYTEGEMIDAVEEYNPIAEKVVASTIDIDKGIQQPLVQPQTVDVAYSVTGFSPPSITLVPGDTIRWHNNSTGDLMLRSNPHPGHTEFPALNADVASGAQFSFTFSGPASFGYHNHNAPTNSGTVLVQ